MHSDSVIWVTYRQTIDKVVTKSAIDKTVTQAALSKTVYYYESGGEDENMTDYLSKRPEEKFTTGGDFSNVLPTGESIVNGNSSVSVEDVNGVDVTSSIIVTNSQAVSGTILQARVQGGVDTASPYKIVYHAVTDTEEEYEVVQYMEVDPA